jgi:hypothetical protein
MGEKLTICSTGGPPGASAVIRKAAGLWNYKKFNFTFAADSCLDQFPAHTDDDVNYVDFGPVGSDAAFTESRNVPATSQTTECDIRFNASKPWYVGNGPPPAGKLDLLSVAIHELGHCLGLDEGDLKDTVMEQPLLPGTMRRVLQPDDIKGRNSIYGEP